MDRKFMDKLERKWDIEFAWDECQNQGYKITRKEFDKIAKKIK